MDLLSPIKFSSWLPAFYFWLGGMSVVLCLLAYTAYSNRQLIDYNTDRIDALIESRTKDRWTATDSENWIQEFTTLNPGLKIPKYKPEIKRMQSP